MCSEAPEFFNGSYPTQTDYCATDPMKSPDYDEECL